MFKGIHGWVAGAIVVATLVGGCQTPLGRTVTDPVGPGPGGGVTDRGVGQLRVHTATEERRDYASTVWVPTGYTIYTRTGAKVRSVVNHLGDLGESPSVIVVPAGRYLIIARAAGVGLVTVPVVVMANRMTEVFLGRNGMPGSGWESDRKVARLAPGDRVIGWLAPPEPTAPKPK